MKKMHTNLLNLSSVLGKELNSDCPIIPSGIVFKVIYKCKNVCYRILVRLLRLY